MSTPHANFTLPTILCCICGTSMHTNPTNMCASCLHDRIDVTAEINKKLTIHSCRSCGRFLGPPWQEVDLESKELLVMCLRKINGLNKVKLIDAAWIWTEPHSMRLKIKLTVQKDIGSGAYLQQSTIAEFVIRNQQCKHCEASYATGAWHAIVQVRQRVTHKRTFFYLEQLMLKHEAHKECVKIVTFRDGIDFYFKEKNQALRFIDFLEGVVPTKNKYSRKLISADKKANTAEYKHNYLIEIAPICKDDLVLLPKELAAKQSNINPLVLVKRVAASIFVVDPTTGEKTDINCEKYWRYSFNALLSSRELTKYYVLSVEPILADHRPSARMKRISTTKIDEDENRTKVKHSIAHSSKLAEIVIVRDRDLGKNDIQFTVVTHLGPLLAPGDYVLGYDLTSTNFNMDEDNKKTLSRIAELPDVILVRKSYEKKDRIWELKNLDEHVEVEGNLRRGDNGEDDKDMEHFLQQVEADREMRQNMNLYKRKDTKGKTSTGKSVGKPSISLKGRKSISKAVEEVEDENEMNEEDDDDEYESYDEEEVRLEDLLDDMSLNSDLGEESEIKVLTADEAANSKAFSVQPPATTSTFDASQFDISSFKFI